jgi:tetratricopeptide (TPR) repeat protein
VEAAGDYLVDGMGRRVGKKRNGVLLKQWVYRDALKPVAELDGAGNLVSEFVYGSKSSVADYVRRGGNTYRVISDQLGSPRYVNYLPPRSFSMQPPEQAHVALRDALALAALHPDEALASLRTAIAKCHQRGDAAGAAMLAKHAGVLSLELGNYDAALEDLDSARKIEPTSASLVVARGNVLEKMGRAAAARSEFEQALTLARISGDASSVELAEAALANLKGP